MRREALAGAIIACLLATACSRLTFIRPDASRGDSERVAPEYDFRDDERTKTRMALQDHLRLGQHRFRAGEFDLAEAQARAALKVDADSADAYTLLALIEERRGNGELAGEHYRKATALAPTAGAALNNYGVWLCRNGRAQESLAWFDRALADRRYATPASALANAGACAGMAGQYDRVERDLRAALSLDPENAVALEAMAEHQFRNGRYLEARAFSERRLGSAPADASALLLASQIEDKLGDKAAAARYVQRLRTEFPQARTAQPGEGSSP
jgi:type IV pilus assembly protein PilF